MGLIPAMIHLGCHCRLVSLHYSLQLPCYLCS